MPTEAKIRRVDLLRDKLQRCSIAVSADFTGIGGNDITELRRRMRGAGVEFTVVKTSLMKLACEEANFPQAKDIVDGPTAMAFGYDDPVDVAKLLLDYIRTTRSVLNIRGAILGSRPVLSPSEVSRMATLPARPQLVASLLGQLQAPVQRLLAVLNGPVRNLDALLQARIKQLESGGSGT